MRPVTSAPPARITRRRPIETFAAFGAAAPSFAVTEGAFPFPAAPAGGWTSLPAAGFTHPVPAYVFNGTALQSGMPLSSARIDYWGHYPVVDLRARFPEVPLEMGLRAFSPFIPGDAAVSNTPAALFELEFRNTGNDAMPLRLRLNLPTAPAGAAIAVRGEALAAEIVMPAHGIRRVRFAVGWYAPSWRDSGQELRVNRYTQRFRNANEVAEFALTHHDTLLRRILAWQQRIYATGLSAWLADALIQGLYSLAKNSVWIARTRRNEWWGENGEPYEYGVRKSGDHARNIFVGESLCDAMTFLYEKRTATGLESARRLYEAMAVKTRSPWNQRCLLNGQTGLPEWGDDYYSNPAIWSVPMALAARASISSHARSHCRS